jgi:hypothetical protein
MARAGLTFKSSWLASGHTVSEILRVHCWVGRPLRHTVYPASVSSPPAKTGLCRWPEVERQRWSRRSVGAMPALHKVWCVDIQTNEGNGATGQRGFQWCSGCGQPVPDLAESQLLVLLKHGHVARVGDAGSAPPQRCPSYIHVGAGAGLNK